MYDIGTLLIPSTFPVDNNIPILIIDFDILRILITFPSISALIEVLILLSC